MLIRNIISVIAGLVVAGCFVPYAIDIIHGKVKPARSARIMFVVLLMVALLQQRQLGAGWTLAITFGEG